MYYPKTGLFAGTIVALLFSILSIPPVLAATTTQIQRTNGIGANAFWPPDTKVGQFSDISLFVDKSSAGTDIRLGYDTPGLLGANAFLTTTANVFQTNGLNSATLSPVTLNVCVAEDDFGNCTFVPVTIQATWSGFGGTESGGKQFGIVASCPPLQPAALKFFNCGQGIVSLGGTSRQATATATMNGQNLGQTSTQFHDARIFNFAEIVINFIPPLPTGVHNP
jgi:hypothetical protein